MKQLLLILLVSGYSLLGVLSLATVNLKIGAFNVHNLGPKKMDKSDVVQHLVHIIQNYDIILIQEILTRDAAEDLKRAVGSRYNMEISDGLGSTSRKEFYAFFYKNDGVVKKVDSYQYPGNRYPDGFERPPFSVLFNAAGLSFPFVLTGLHTKPLSGQNQTTVTEMKNLLDVHAAVVRKWNTQNVMILGDLNFDKPYVPDYARTSIPIRTSHLTYKWMIEDGKDTTLSQTVKTYDRIIVAGDSLKAVVHSGDVYKFDQWYELNEEQAKAVSDHYPVEVKLRVVAQSVMFNPGFHNPNRPFGG